MGVFGVFAGQCVGPIGDREEIKLDLERPPQGPEEREGRQDQPDDDKAVGGQFQAGWRALCFRCHVSACP